MILCYNLSVNDFRVYVVYNIDGPITYGKYKEHRHRGVWKASVAFN